MAVTASTRAQLAKALGLPDDATPEEILAALRTELEADGNDRTAATLIARVNDRIRPQIYQAMRDAGRDPDPAYAERIIERNGPRPGRTAQHVPPFQVRRQVTPGVRERTYEQPQGPQTLA